MVACEFPISAPGLLHLSTLVSFLSFSVYAKLLIGCVCATLGFMTHLHSSWVSKEEYKSLCETTDKVWKATTDIECPDISLETAFLIIVCLSVASSMLWYMCELCCLGGSKSASLFYVIYLVLGGVACIIAGSLYIKSAVLIAQLPAPDYVPVFENMWKVLYAAFHNAKPDDMKLTTQTDEQTYYQEKVATGALTMLNGLLHIMCAWLVILDKK